MWTSLCESQHRKTYNVAVRQKKTQISLDISSDLKVIKLEFILRLKIKRNDWLLALLFESETVLKFYNLEARTHGIEQNDLSTILDINLVRSESSSSVQLITMAVCHQHRRLLPSLI